MMEPIEKNEGKVLDEDTPPASVPPPPPTTAPPLEDDTPPPKPKKTSRRGVSPSHKENEAPKENDTPKENGVKKLTNGDKNNDDEDGILNTSFGSGGVAKIVDEIEKYGSLGKGKSRDASRLEDVCLADDTSRSTSKLTPFEKSVLRELPVDVDMEEVENQKNVRKVRRSKSCKEADEPEENGSSGGEDSPRKGRSAVKRTPTMEFKKQCSKIGRIRTKILQNLGKADKTTDETFDEYEANFTRQQTNANRLHKEVSNYLRCARALHGASKALFETLADVYEGEWTGSDLIYAQAQNSDMLWTDFVHKLQDQTLAPLTAYQIQFPEIRKKIDKRGRKLVDYDSQRHQLEALQRSGRRDEYKMARCRDQLELARTTYDLLNKELYEELPGIYDQRVGRTAETLQSLYSAEGTFMRESSKIAQELESISDKLVQESGTGKYRTTRGTPVTPRPVSTVSAGTPASKPQSAKEEVGRPYEEIQFDDGTKVNGAGVVGTKVPPGATTQGLPAGVLYQVRTTYKYDKEDVDELSFDVGETINVVEYEDPEEQEEGWLCGYKASTNEKGLFPANFTRPI